MKRNQYQVRIYETGVILNYKNYKSAYNRCNTLIARGLNCGIYLDGVCIIGC